MKALYTAATGMAAQQMRIENISNNLANVSTVGFKKSRESFEDLIYQNLPVGACCDGRTRNSGLQTGTGVRIGGLTRDFAVGDLQQTTSPFDVAIAGRGFFVIEDVDGQEFYTRNGQFGLNAEGELIMPAGYMVSPGIEVPADATEVRIAEDGTITALFSDDNTDEVTLGTLRLVDFVNPAGLRSVGGNLFIASPESGQPLDLDPSTEVRVQQGFLETSNVDVAEELVNMIMAQRAFEMTSKAVEAGDQMMNTVNGMKR